MDKLVNRKLDLIMEKLGIDTKEFKAPPPPEPRKLTPQEQDAIANAPKVGLMSGPIAGPRVTATNAPDVSASTPPAAPIGKQRKG